MIAPNFSFHVKLGLTNSVVVQYRQTFPVEGHDLKCLFHNGRRKTTIFIGLFLMTSSNTKLLHQAVRWRPLWNWACFDFRKNEFNFKKILEDWIKICLQRQKVFFLNSLQLLLKPLKLKLYFSLVKLFLAMIVFQPSKAEVSGPSEFT